MTDGSQAGSAGIEVKGLEFKTRFCNSANNGKLAPTDVLFWRRFK
jgi:hypothetical protein